MAKNRWPQDKLKVIIKGQKGKGGGGSMTVTNAEIEDILDKMSDDHEPGNEQGKDADIPDEAKDDAGKAGGDIDQNAEQVEDQVAEGAAKGQQEGAEKPSQQTSKGPSQNSKDGQRGGRGSYQNVNYSQIAPRFNWRTLVNKFVTASMPKSVETYTKPSRKSVTGMHVASQVGAAAIKPGEKVGEVVDLKLGFLLDCSGSMLDSVARMFAEANKLLKDPRFAKSEVYVMKFSSRHEVWKGIFARNKAHRVKDINEKSHGVYETTMQHVFSTAEGGGTEISEASHKDSLALLARGYNLLLLTDTDILWDHNIKLVLDLIKKYPRNMFIIMRDRQCYLEWRQKTGIATPNITHF